LSETSSHDDFLELCALAASGQLTAAENRSLELHLAGCSSCREAMQQYGAIVDRAIPAIAATQTPEFAEHGSRWSSQRAKKALFDQIAREEKSEPADSRHATSRKRDIDPSPAFRFQGAATWRHVWLLYAAAVLLSIGLGVCAYWVGTRHGMSTGKQLPAQPDAAKEAALEEKLSDAGHEREVAQAQISQRDRTIAELHRELSRAAEALRQMRAAEERLARDASTQGTSADELSRQKKELADQLKDTQVQADALAKKLSLLQRQSAQDGTRATTLEAEVGSLTQQLQERAATVDQQQELLAHDRDIRELMGARDLYIAEVYDVGKTGTTQKPYGRVFYTKGKSLIFYAYDLDQPYGVRDAKTFQAWGRRGPDPHQALNLGIFYVDNAAKKRWVLKLDDPKRLAQIDAVFVTVEPNGGSRKPSGQPLLFTYLKVEPNHP
jgi:hypothetical protein